jgi:hypothetical protein
MPGDYDPGSGYGILTPPGWNNHDAYEACMAQMVGCVACCGIDSFATMIAKLQEIIEELRARLRKVNGGAPCDIHDFICNRAKRRLWAAIDGVQALIALLRLISRSVVFEDCVTQKALLPDGADEGIDGIFGTEIFENSEIQSFKNNYNAISSILRSDSNKTPKGIIDNMRVVGVNVISFINNMNTVFPDLVPPAGHLGLTTIEGIYSASRSALRSIDENPAILINHTNRKDILQIPFDIMGESDDTDPGPDEDEPFDECEEWKKKIENCELMRPEGEPPETPYPNGAGWTPEWVVYTLCIAAAFGGFLICLMCALLPIFLEFIRIAEEAVEAMREMIARLTRLMMAEPIGSHARRKLMWQILQLERELEGLEDELARAKLQFEQALANC